MLRKIKYKHVHCLVGTWFSERSLPAGLSEALEFVVVVAVGPHIFSTISPPLPQDETFVSCHEEAESAPHPPLLTGDHNPASAVPQRPAPSRPAVPQPCSDISASSFLFLSSSCLLFSFSAKTTLQNGRPMKKMTVLHNRESLENLETSHTVPT